jgi:hypothetical protein
MKTCGSEKRVIRASHLFSRERSIQRFGVDRMKSEKVGN